MKMKIFICHIVDSKTNTITTILRSRNKLCSNLAKTLVITAVLVIALLPKLCRLHDGRHTKMFSDSQSQCRI